MADPLRGLLEREFHRRRTPHDRIRLACQLAQPRAALRSTFRTGLASALLTRWRWPTSNRASTFYLRFGEPAHAPARPLAALRGRSCWRYVLPHPLAGQRLRHDPLAAHGDAGLHAARRGAAYPRRAAGARVLLHAEANQPVRAVLERIDAIEALGIAPVGVSSAYWRNARQPARLRAAAAEYTAERARRLAGREGTGMTTLFHAGTARASARPAHVCALASCGSGSVRLRPAAGLGVLRASAAAPDLQPVRQRGGRLVSRRSVRPRHRLAATSGCPWAASFRPLLPPDAAALARSAATCRRACRCSSAWAPSRRRRCASLAGQSSASTACLRPPYCPPTVGAGRCHPWQQCRRLNPDELFLLSVTNPASFDSRYFSGRSAHPP